MRFNDHFGRVAAQHAEHRPTTLFAALNARESCDAEHLVAFRCKRRGFCRELRGAAHGRERGPLLVDEVFPEQPAGTRQR